MITGGGTRIGSLLTLIGMAVALPVLAQDRPPRTDEPASATAQPDGTDAKPPVARPADLSTAPSDAAPPEAAPSQAAPAEAPQPDAPAVAGETATGEPSPPAAALPDAGTDATSVQPDGTPADAPEAPAEPAAVPAPTGPPAHSLLREDDFAFEACRLELQRLGTVYTVEPAVTGEQRDCGIDRPVKVTAILPGVTLEGGADMRCDTARALAWWMRDFVTPAAARLPGAPLPVSLALGSTYQCRATVGTSSAKLSEHALGNAIDIAQFTFDDGSVLPVSSTEVGSAGQAFLLAVRWAACMDFATVLGPGSNAAHDNHLHLDVKARRGGYRVCE